MANQIVTNTSTLQDVLNQIDALPDYVDVAAPLAELNVANGGTQADSISAAVDNTETLAIDQEALIVQIAEALEDKIITSGTNQKLQTCNVSFVFENSLESGNPPKYFPDSTMLVLCYTKLNHDTGITCRVEEAPIKDEDYTILGATSFSRDFECVCGTEILFCELLTVGAEINVSDGVEVVYSNFGVMNQAQLSVFRIDQVGDYSIHIVY